MEWSDNSEKLDIVYYRYVLSFLYYAKYQGCSYQTVKQHLNQCQQLAMRAYGKYMNRTRDILGYLDEDRNDRARLVLLILCTKYPFNRVSIFYGFLIFGGMIRAVPVQLSLIYLSRERPGAFSPFGRAQTILLK